jgi:hypothetical protein
MVAVGVQVTDRHCKQRRRNWGIASGTRSPTMSESLWDATDRGTIGVGARGSAR